MKRGSLAAALLVSLASLSLASCRGCANRGGTQQPTTSGVRTRVPCPQDLSGSWRIGYDLSCTAKQGVARVFGATQVVADGCDLKFTVAELGDFQGRFEGRNGSASVVFSAPCRGNADGALTLVTDSKMEVTFRGTSVGEDARCCADIYGTITMIKLAPTKTPAPAVDTPTAVAAPGPAGKAKASK